MTAATVDPAPPPLAPPQDFARLACPHCGRVLRFESRAVVLSYGVEAGWVYQCPNPECRRELGRVVISPTGMTRLRLAAV